MSSAGTTTVLCAGDRFITPDALAEAVRSAFDAPVETIGYATAWPDEPFGPVDGVVEASGDPNELARLAKDAQVIVTHLAPISRTVIEAASGLALVGVTRGGPVNVDLAAATKQGVPVAFLPGRNLDAVAEYTLGLMISLPRGVPSASRELADGRWDARWFRHDLTGPQLGRSTVGVVGLGAVGRRVAQLAAALGAHVVGHDPYVDDRTAADLGVERLGFDELLAVSDVVTVHARLTDESRHLFGDRAFGLMKPGAYFVNTARGELVDQGALLQALESGRLRGAALDVFEPEPPVAGDPLLAHPGVLATPHLAGASRQVASDSAARVAEAAATFLRTGTLEHCANPGWDAAGSRTA